MAQDENINTHSDEEGFFKVYQTASTNLRTWLIAYGIGSPVLFLTHDNLCDSLKEAGCLKCVGILFLIGVGLQVLIATINKNVMWLCYYGEGDSKFKAKFFYKVAEWLSCQFWIDISCDILSIVLFIIATYQVFNALC